MKQPLQYRHPDGRLVKQLCTSTECLSARKSGTENGSHISPCSMIWPMLKDFDVDYDGNDCFANAQDFDVFNLRRNNFRVNSLPVRIPVQTYKMNEI